MHLQIQLLGERVETVYAGPNTWVSEESGAVGTPPWFESRSQTFAKITHVLRGASKILVGRLHFPCHHQYHIENDVPIQRTRTGKLSRPDDVSHAVGVETSGANHNWA